LAPKAGGRAFDAVVPHISTSDHDHGSARPWRPTGAGKPRRWTPEVEDGAGALQAEAGCDLASIDQLFTVGVEHH
jgi:hypothetical protein